MNRLLLTLLCFISLLCTRAPAQKAIDVEDMQKWNRIRGEELSADGSHLLYTLEPDTGDPTAIVYNVTTKQERYFPRLHNARLSYDGKYLIGMLKPARDTVIHYNLKDRAKELKEMDSLLVWDLSGSLVIHPNAYEVKMSERAAEVYAYTTPSILPDSLKKGLDKEAKRLIVRRFSNQDSFYVEGIHNFMMARDRPVVVARRTAKDSTWTDGVLRLDPAELKWQTLSEAKGTYGGLGVSFDGNHVGYFSHDKAKDNKQPPFHLHYWQAGQDSASVVTDRSLPWLPKGFRISDDRAVHFSENGDYLFFGTTPRRPELDSNSLSSEMADEEVWTSEDPLLYTRQNNQLRNDREFTFLAVYRTEKDDFLQLANADMPEASMPGEGKGDYVMLYNETAYQKETMWEGGPAARDAWIVDLKDGDRQQILTGEPGRFSWSPEGNYVAWYNQQDTSYHAYNVRTNRRVQLTDNQLGTFYDEINDRPMHPYPYGYGGWLEDDDRLIINDRFDLWMMDPSGGAQPERLTRGRETNTVYRFVDLYPEREIGEDETILLSTFSEESYHGGYATLDLESGTVTALNSGPKSFGDFSKARNAERYLYTQEDFREFPDLRITNSLAIEGTVVTTANPQQAEYKWGTAEGYTWTDHEGRELRGLLIKPDDFDPSKQYPLLVNYYERSSEGLYRHRTPVPGRSSVNYAHYVSRGYVIFNPDVIYREGYPGESAYTCVMSGVSSLIDEGFIDKEHIGMQGHSWGGYQAAYLATKTNLFAAIEAGAPVVNMFSAYGGIRWGSGLSRQFQYEHTQSRIGGSPWEYPLRYLENSPLFTADKINTPILILHNDADGAVPWYQGIEFFTALRRLGKPTWMLNYRGEPHWPVKGPNRADFQKRMSQFFDHYLMDAPMPTWMQRGVSPMERGIDQNLELLEMRE